jgi:hypothetical protein
MTQDRRKSKSDYKLIGILLLVFTSSSPAEAKSVIEHGPIQSLPIPDGWNPSHETHQFIDPRQNLVVFCGRRTGTTLSLRTIRKPGRKLSDQFEALLRQPPRNLKPEETAFANDIISIDQINRKFTDGIGASDANIQLKDPALALLGGRHILRGTYDSYFMGCSQTAPFNGAYKTLVILADADGTGAAVEEITMRAKEQDYEEAVQQINGALAEITWKKDRNH